MKWIGIPIQNLALAHNRNKVRSDVLTKCRIVMLAPILPWPIMVSCSCYEVQGVIEMMKWCHVFGCATEIQGYSNKKYCAIGQEHQTQVHANACIFKLTHCRAYTICTKAYLRMTVLWIQDRTRGKNKPGLRSSPCKWSRIFLSVFAICFGNISAWCTIRCLYWVMCTYVYVYREQTR